MQRILSGLIVAVLLAGCHSKLTQAEAARLVRARMGDAPSIACAWEGQVERVDDRNGRWSDAAHVQGGDTFHDSPEDRARCLAAMEEAGVIRTPTAAGVFELGADARFDSEHNVEFRCRVGRVEEVTLRPDQGTTAVAYVTLAGVRDLPRVSVLSGDNGACRGSSTVGTGCTAHFTYDGGWRLTRVDGPGFCHD